MKSGTLLAGGYVLGPEAERGAMASLHRARDVSGRRVAAKRLLDERHAERQRIEARVLRSLDHPRVVKVLDLVEDPAGRYLIMEWVDGVTLARVLARDGDPGLPPDHVLNWTLQAAEGLAYVHEQQTVHRDVKPQNLMLSPDRGIVVVDFGIARTFTHEGTMEIGTPGYMAPETYAGGAVTARTDVYGLASSAWTLIAGHPPPLGAPGPLAGATPALTQALRAALAVDPRERTPSMAAFAEALGGRLRGGDGRDMAVVIDIDPSRRPLLESVVRTVAGVFDAAASSLALVRPGGSLLYYAAWGAGAEEIVGRELDPGRGIASRVIENGRPQLVADVHDDPDWDAGFAQRTGFVPSSMMLVPLEGPDGPLGVLSMLDRRDGRPYDVEDLGRARLFARLALDALLAGRDAEPETRTTG
ncbi:protein kinase [Solirubrobacter ginsenosidimutans]|uniref:Protein kinase n=1 Tax=Solirubrobacter ginsenosidimutans TaxID=490573 RepID=A0A9X3S4S9_9ACTN|nr:protein kinase [Solirubrobacter ginsenosidimutans]MDA0166980.1 protein kinase [Solirubrobacter ginsenosidimutans]